MTTIFGEDPLYKSDANIFCLKKFKFFQDARGSSFTQIVSNSPDHLGETIKIDFKCLTRLTDRELRI